MIERNERGQFVKGHNFRKGTKHSIETKKKMSEAWEHREHTWGDKISVAMKGKMPKNIEIINGIY